MIFFDKLVHFIFIGRKRQCSNHRKESLLVNNPHLKEDLAQTRKRGYSFDDEEHALGLRCLAACIFDEQREPFAAISISGPLSRITDDRVTEFGAMVIKAAKEVTLSYGEMCIRDRSSTGGNSGASSGDLVR